MIFSKMTIFQLSLLSFIVILSHSAEEGSTNLLLVITVFRHGDRAPIILYPTDPNEVDNWPNGLGQLTQLGKKEHYKVGKFLRKMYGGFDTTNPNQIYVNSSDDDRCLNSAESNLASFYAPTRQFRIAENLKWQPIPVHYLPFQKDIYLNVRAPCPRFKAAFSKALNSRKFKRFYKENQAIADDITNKSGLNFSDPKEALVLYDTLDVERMHNLIIPEWANTYWPEITYVAHETLDAYYDSPIQLRLRTGPFLGLLTENLMKKINGSTPNLKFILNSSHDINIAGILRALNFTGFPRPPYCATLLFELHEMPDTSKAVRLLYMNSTNPSVHLDKPQVLFLDGCSEFCPVEQFIKSYEWLIPRNYTEECQVDCDTEGSGSGDPGKLSKFGL